MNILIHVYKKVGLRYSIKRSGKGARAQVHHKKIPTELSPFVKNVTTHVLLHEIGHALIREFNLPVLANEENMADSFATNYITQYLRDNAVEIITHRAQSWFIEDQEVNPINYDLKGEHELDKRRAYASLCLLYGADPAQWRSDIAWANFSKRDLADCSDTAPQQIESWKSTLLPFVAKITKNPNSVIIIYGEGPYKKVMRDSEILERIAVEANRFTWPETVTLHFDHCDGSASWQRKSRTIRLCDNYIKRFIQQEARISSLASSAITQKAL